MSKANPRKAIDALIPAPIRTECGVVVRPLTLGIYALLERYRSPLVTGEAGDTLDILPSLFVLTHEPGEAMDGSNLLVKAVAWADTLPPRAIEEIHTAALRQVSAMLDVIPESAPQKKKAITGGLSRSRSGRRRPTGGNSRR